MFVKSLILASGSPFRRTLMEESGLNFSVHTTDVDETAIIADSVAKIASKRAIAKASAVAEAHRQSIVIGADQTLEFKEQCFDKVTSEEEALSRLKELAGKTHYLHSAYCLVYQDKELKVLKERVVSVKMKMRALAEEELQGYVKTGEWQGSVGCYKIEQKGICLMEEIGGDASSIIGLPLIPLLKDLRDFTINPLLSAAPPLTVD